MVDWFPKTKNLWIKGLLLILWAGIFGQPLGQIGRHVDRIENNIKNTQTSAPLLAYLHGGSCRSALANSNLTLSFGAWWTLIRLPKFLVPDCIKSETSRVKLSSKGGRHLHNSGYGDQAFKWHDTIIFADLTKYFVTVQSFNS